MKEIYYLDGVKLSNLTEKEDIERFNFYKLKLQDLEERMRNENAYIEIYKKENKISISGNVSLELTRKIREVIHEI